METYQPQTFQRIDSVRILYNVHLRFSEPFRITVQGFTDPLKETAGKRERVGQRDLYVIYTLTAWLTNRVAQTEMVQPESARQEQFSSCSKTSGHLKESAWAPNPASSTPVWSQSCFTDETWRTTQTMHQKIQTFFNTCLKRIYKIQSQEKIQNEDLWEPAGQEPAAKQILWRKWGWIEYTLRKHHTSSQKWSYCFMYAIVLALAILTEHNTSL